MNETRTRRLSFSICGDDAKVTAWIDGTKYAVFVTPETREQVLQDLSRCAANPRTNMTQNDAAEIARMILELVSPPKAFRVRLLPTAPVQNKSEMATLFCLMFPGLVMWSVGVVVIWLVTGWQ